MRFFPYFLLGLLFLSSCNNEKKEKYITSCLFPDGITVEEKARMAAHVVPSERQLEWQKMEKTCFICYGINTFTDKEWGTGKEDPSLFNPTALDAGQWAKTAKEAGMQMILLTCKHHDGFCLWPSAYTDFSVKSTPWKDGKGDLVREVADACKEYGLKFAVYLSPWDMNHPDYGTERYNDFFVNQLTELLTQYGRVDEVWFDGACGEGPNGKKQEYDFKRYYEVIRSLQPEAVIAVMGPDVRWVGTESGYGRDTEWSVLPASAASLADIAESSQQKAGSGTFLPVGDKKAEDLGSRKLLADAKGVIWYPSEVDVSIRPGWYYHADQDSLVKSPQKLIDIYYSSVGKNSLLLLNLPPDKRGLIHENDIRSLQGMTRILDETFRSNLMKSARRSSADVELLTDGVLETYWQGNGKHDAIEIVFRKKQLFDRLLLQENITEGQRVEDFALECWIDNQWKVVAEGTTIGYKRILRFEPVETDKVRIVIRKSRELPQIAEIGLYKASEEESIQSCKKVSEEPVKAFCIDFNWSGRGYAGLSLPGDFSDAEPETHFEWYREHGVNTIQSFCVSHNGYAWYDNEIVPKVPGLKSDFLTELVDMGHKNGMRVMGYFSPGTNVRWLEEHPDEVYDNNSMFHIVYTSEYLDYLGNVIYDAVKRTGIDGFMIDALFTAPRDSSEAMKWMPCEQKIYEELFGEPFPGKERITYEVELEYKRRSTERCWDTIYQAAKRADPDCIVWLTCHNLTHPQIRPGSRIFKQADWLMSENSDPKYLKMVQNAIGPHTQLIQCISGWASHDAKSLMDQSGDTKLGWYGFAWPDTATTLPYTVESAKDNERFRRNAINIEEMQKFYKGE